MRNVTVAATQIACSWNRKETLEKAEKMVRDAAAAGAQIILLQELFETPYFCQTHKYEYMHLAARLEDNPAVQRFRQVAKELKVVLPISFYEDAGNTAYNSIAIIDADGTILGRYRKTHIPDGRPYAEKFYFTPGNTGFRVWDTAYAKIGVGICWDQWFPETARSLALNGAEILFFPTAIGSEPSLQIDSMPHWRLCMQGHAAANIMPLVASNRVGKEVQDDSEMTFYGSSFIAGPTGELAAEADRTSETFITATFDLDAVAQKRREWGIFRDRRPETYRTILTQGGDEKI
ncbi:MAG: N-carbamoylputrescine amidase [Eubacterium sp.]|nr:N-carbamoylputrescine amidase [Eubacterium sp.]